MENATATGGESPAETSPFQTELSEACHLVGGAHIEIIETISQVEKDLDVLINKLHATAVRLVTSVYRKGPLELVRVESRLRPAVFWVVKHILHDTNPEQTRFVVVVECATFVEAALGFEGLIVDESGVAEE